MSLRFAETPSGVIATYTVQGHSDRKRGALWTYGNNAPAGAGVHDLGDHLKQLGDALGEVRPATLHAVERALSGEYWEQATLWD